METNGRVNITGFNPFMRFQMHDKIATQQQDTSFKFDRACNIKYR